MYVHHLSTVSVSSDAAFSNATQFTYLVLYESSNPPAPLSPPQKTGELNEGPPSPIRGRQDAADAAAGAKSSFSPSRRTIASATAAPAGISPSSASTSTAHNSSFATLKPTGDEVIHGATSSTALVRGGGGGLGGGAAQESPEIPTLDVADSAQPSAGGTRGGGSGAGLKFTRMGRKMNRAHKLAAEATAGAEAAFDTNAASIITSDLPGPAAREPEQITTVSAVSEKRMSDLPPSYDQMSSAGETPGRNSGETAAGAVGMPPPPARTMPVSALRGAGSGLFQNRQRRSVSFADCSDSNSDYDARAYEDGRSAHGAGATLRQVRVPVWYFTRISAGALGGGVQVLVTIFSLYVVACIVASFLCTIICPCDYVLHNMSTSLHTHTLFSREPTSSTPNYYTRLYHSSPGSFH